MAIKPHMFSRIFDFRYERTKLQAFGFYLCQLIIYLMLAGVVMGFLMAAGGMGDEFEKQVNMAKIMGPGLGLAHALAMTIFMLKAKNMENSRKHILIGALAIIFGGLGGPLVSLIPVAYLSTKPVAPPFVKP